MPIVKSSPEISVPTLSISTVIISPRANLLLAAVPATEEYAPEAMVGLFAWVVKIVVSEIFTSIITVAPDAGVPIEAYTPIILPLAGILAEVRLFAVDSSPLTHRVISCLAIIVFLIL